MCKAVPDPSALPDAGTPPEIIPLCALPQPLLCQPCDEDLDCGGSGGDLCLQDGIHGFCGMDCTFETCPEGYTCGHTARGRQCQPVGQSCDCGPDDLGRLRGCGNESDVGICYGSQVCTLAGWGACSAPAAVAETCNGLDDDCNGLVDDEQDAQTCTRANAFGTCEGPRACLGAAGTRCDAPTPAAETCNYVDDDCDGTTDNPFVDGQGRYVQGAHCGGCGNDCQTLIPNSVATTCALDSNGAPVCRVTACAVGFFPSPDQTRCLQLADSLCEACVKDEDCKGPGSACVDIGAETICTRSCGPGSPFGACPSGYICQGLQCIPQSGTCACNAAQVGMTRSCQVQTCEGFQQCQGSGGGFAWSACDVDSFNPEICDGVDNNCNGDADEGFKNAVTGRYDATLHCGFCNNDCSKYWSEPLQHTTGVCDASTPMPTCQMGPCSTETVGGVSFEWVNVNGDTQDGCECRRVLGNLTTDEPQELAPFVDENCDGVDGVAQHAVFVWAGAQPGGNGSITQPFRTLGQGVSSLLAQPQKRYVLVAEGVYAENVAVGPRVRLYGGYSQTFQKRDPILFQSLIQGQESLLPLGPQAALHAQNIPPGAQAAAVSGFTVRGPDILPAGDDQPGRASYAVMVENASNALRIVGNDILAGKGGQGGRGSTGAQGFGRQVSPALDGADGLNQVKLPGSCPASTNRAGGAGGQNFQCGANGNGGGSVTCPAFNWSTTPVQGAQAPYPPGSPLDGEGGFDWSYDSQSNSNCGHVTESGFPSNIQTHDGHNGKAGPDGQSGQGGAGAPARARFGSTAGNRWVPSSFGAAGGLGGVAAQGGGGGGAGGGTFRFPAGGCQDYELGASGGGGGAGGCGGAGGQQGGAGGASIALFVTFSATPPASQVPVIEHNRIERNTGGAGGNGGFGGAGGQGGTGGFGGIRTTWSGSRGGKGGDGGNGGFGGGGGGGAGGPSFGLLAFRLASPAWQAQNTFLTSGSALTGGSGGAGGSSSGAGATGTAGADGASANFHALIPCAAGCPGGSLCDANGVCAP